MQEEGEIYEQAIKDSARKLLVVKTLSNFFNHRDLFAVYVRTKVIHNLFEGNRSLDVNKLNLFHIQYTDTLIELFQKLKRSKEQQYLLISDEIYINDDLASKLEKEVGGMNFAAAAKNHGSVIAGKLRQLYAILEGSSSGGFSWNDALVFQAKSGQEFYREITDAEIFLSLTDTDGRKTYQTEYGAIERKLLGRLNIVNFRIKFACGLQYRNEFIEVFDFIDSNERFLFIPGIRTFLFLDEKIAAKLDLSKNVSDRERIINDLRLKNDMLHERLATIKTSLPADVEEVLAGYLEKISGVDFLDELQNVDEQTNILRAMLNININTR